MDGILIIDKPQGLTSHDVVDLIRNRFKIRKVGHGGTLDPQATGVLVILLGRATKLFSRIIELEKEYLGAFFLGKATTTQDREGEVIAEEKDSDKIKSLKPELIRKVFEELVGEIILTPPMFSALHYRGRRLYELAREGKFVVRQPRKAKIYEFKLIRFKPPLIDFGIICSRGTYIRSLCEEIERRILIPLYLYSLRRIRMGEFRLEDALTLESLREIKSLPELEKFVIAEKIIN